MPKPTATVDYQVCDPKKCPAERCLAVEACEHKVLRQDAPDEGPYALGMCTACGACVTACPLKAIRLR